MMRAIASPSRWAQAAKKRAKALRCGSSSSPDQAEVEQGQLVVGGDEDVARVQVGVHEAVLEDHLQQRLEAEARDPLGIGAGRAGRQDLRAGDEAHGQDALGGQRLDRPPGRPRPARPGSCRGSGGCCGPRCGNRAARRSRGRTPRRRRRAPASRSTGCAPSTRAPIRITARSKVQISTTFGRRTLTATMRPSGRRALCTCDTDADASGTGANSAKIARERAPEVALDRARPPPRTGRGRRSPAARPAPTRCAPG